MIGRLSLGKGQATARVRGEILLAIYTMREWAKVLEEEKPTNALRLKCTGCWVAVLGTHMYGPTLCGDLQSRHNGEDFFFTHGVITMVGCESVPSRKTIPHTIPHSALNAKQCRSIVCPRPMSKYHEDATDEGATNPER
jgi:hypothetical protein